ncbi:MAG: hypothetical protein HC860_24100 [Alkalinema sp. RU_4_3]|nr:hypothetical protein [Alkalinema sp. RU_4_3]
MLNLTLLQNELIIGDRLTGRVIWTGNNQPKEIKLTIGWRTEGRGTVEAEKVSCTPDDAGHFNYQIPLKAPSSYDGHILRIIWEVTAIAKPKGPMSKEVNITKTFYVAPR